MQIDSFNHTHPNNPKITQVTKNAASMAARLAKVVVPLDYHTTYAVILKKLAALPVRAYINWIYLYV